MQAATESRSALQTVGAIPLALVTWMVVSTLATALWFLLNFIFTVTRPEIIGFFANISGGVVGVSVAKAATNRWLPRASGKPVAIAFYVFCAFLLFMEWGFLPNPAHPILVSAAAVASIFTAYYGYWLGEDIG